MREYVLSIWKKFFHRNNDKNIATMREYLRRSGIPVWNDLFDRVGSVGMDGAFEWQCSSVDKTAYTMIFRYLAADTNFQVNDTYIYKKAKSVVCDLLKENVLPLLHANIKSIFDATTETTPEDVRSTSFVTFLHMLINLLDHVITPIEKANRAIADKDDIGELNPKIIEYLNGNLNEAKKHLSILEGVMLLPTAKEMKKPRGTRGRDKEKAEKKVKHVQSTLRTTRRGRRAEKAQEESDDAGNVQTVDRMVSLLQEARREMKRKEEEKKRREEEAKRENAPSPKRGRGRPRKVSREESKKEGEKVTEVAKRGRGRPRKVSIEEEKKVMVEEEEKKVMVEEEEKSMEEEPKKTGVEEELQMVEEEPKKVEAEEPQKTGVEELEKVNSEEKGKEVEEKPVTKRGRGRPKKVYTEEELKKKEEEKRKKELIKAGLKRGRGRPKKVYTEEELKKKEEEKKRKEELIKAGLKRGRGRPKKVYTEEELKKREEEKQRKKEENRRLVEAGLKRGRGRPRKNPLPLITRIIPAKTTPVIMTVEENQDVQVIDNPWSAEQPKGVEEVRVDQPKAVEEASKEQPKPVEEASVEQQGQPLATPRTASSDDTVDGNVFDDDDAFPLLFYPTANDINSVL